MIQVYSGGGEMVELDGFKYALHCRELGIGMDDVLAQILNVRGGLLGVW